MESKWGHVEPIFLERMQKRKSVFRLHRRVRIACEPIPWSAQGDPKIKEKTWHISEPTFLIKKCKNIRKRGPKRGPKGWGDFGGGGLGGALDAPICFWTQKVCPKCSKNDLQGAKVTPKCFKSDPQGRKMHSYRSAKVVQVHQKMSAARYQARRTARSAFNNQKQRTQRRRLRRPPHWVCVSESLSFVLSIEN